MRLRQPAWSIATNGWSTDDHPECVTLRPPQDDAALQISIRTKTIGHIDDDEVRAMADRDAQQYGVAVLPTRCGGFAGVTVAFTEGGHYWRRWWLVSDAILLYVTYNTDSSTRDHHRAHVDQMLATLKPEERAVEQ